VKVLQIHPFLRGDHLNPRAGGKSRASLQLTHFLQTQIEVAVFPFPERIFGGKITFGVPSEEEVTILPTMGFPAPRALRKAWGKSQKTGSEATTRLRDRCWRLLHWIGLQNALREFQPDLVHLHMSHSDFPTLYRGIGARPPLVLTHHTGKRGENFSLCDFIICISNAFQDSLCAETTFAREKTRVIYSPVQPEFLGADLLPAAQRSGVVFVGRVNAEKGIDLLCHAYAKQPQLRAHPLTVCGAGEEQTHWQEYAAGQQLPIRFLGRQTATEVHALVRRARLVAIPSRSEGFSIALLEALACGTPVVGWAPQVRELEAQWGIPVGMPFDARVQSADELASALLAALESTSQADGARAEMANRIAMDFSIERTGEKHLALYRELVGKCAS
jgi:glycosyltransferase involved in cell wall biosynthesis